MLSNDMMDDFTRSLRDALAPAYELQRELTGGGMSRVYVATERALQRTVVVKVLPPELAAGVNRDRFRREIQLAAQLQHPHIVPLHSAGESGELLWYTMPYIEGASLRESIAKQARFAPKDVIRILHDVLDALAYAHDRGVIHRDIKPGNILRSGTHAVVTDFGVAKAISAALPAAGMTTTGAAIGTPAYMAPEQLAGDPSADHRVDLYAAGLLAYELLTGQAPFVGSSPQAMLAAQLTVTPQPVDQLRPDCPAEFARLIDQLLAKQAADRPQSAREAQAALDAIPISFSGERTGTMPIPAVPAQRPWALVAAVASIAAVLAVVWATTRSAPPAPEPPRPDSMAV
ncbi:MAG: serine/threonine protein kinase, partial [Gemmatimonadaceae bacterium]|nr:serine/threonine protein kinase [Gemmatimonadaceae bacterium]